MQLELFAGFRKLVEIGSVKLVSSWDLEDLSTEGSLGLEGLYYNPCTPTYSLVD